MNYQGAGEPGSHWYGVVKDGTTATVYDSLGFPPDDTVVKLMVNNRVEKIKYQTVRTQNDSDNICGLLAVLSIA